MATTPNQYYENILPPNKEICLRLREIIQYRYPKMEESMLWGVPVFNNGLFYIVALKDHVNLGFTVANLSKEMNQLFDGGGKTTRKIEIKSIADIDQNRIENLLDLVYKTHNEN